jgi:aryl-alcohol dehydrogenase-like predicted oxidoreductase
MPITDRARIVLGTAALGLPYGLPRDGRDAPELVPEEAALALLRTAQQQGLGAIDTAPAYGVAETRIGHARLALPVWTKLAVGLPTAASVQASLRALQRIQIDLLQWHNWTAATASDPVFLATWETLSRDSRVAALGASTYGVEDALAAVRSGFFAVVQVEYNLLNQGVIAAIAEVATRQRVALAVRSVLLQGVLADRPEGLPPRLAGLAPGRERALALAEAWGLTLPALAIRAALDHPAISWVLLGADQPEQLVEILAACDGDPLTAAQQAALAGLDIGPTLTDPRTWPRSA